MCKDFVILNYNKFVFAAGKFVGEVNNKRSINYCFSWQERGVLRIKFLGDCYYCISGVPDQNIYHARNCVDLGLDMIAIIKKVR